MTTRDAQRNEFDWRVGLIVGVAFLAYAFFPWVTSRQEPIRFNSPDETSNYFFTSRIADGQSPTVFDPLNGIAEGTIHPRGSQVVNGRTVPAGFLGLPFFYGAVAFLIGSWVLPLLTPLLASLALLALWAAWRRLISDRTALLGTALVACHPAFWYYASRGFYHNVLFVSLLAFAWWGYWRCREGRWSVPWLVFSEAMLAAALFTRGAEALWLGVVIMAVAWVHRRSWRLPHLVATAAVGAVATLAFVGSALATYGQLTPPGYFGEGEAGAATVSFWAGVDSFVLPFGAHLGRALYNVWWYGLAVVPISTVLVVLGLTFGRARQQLPRWYWLLAVGSTLWLGLYYGSWTVQDTVGSEPLTVGISYVRYWLPLSLLWVPVAALGLEAVGRLAGRYARLWLVAFTFVVGFQAVQQVFFQPVEGFVPIAERLEQYRTTSRLIESSTPTDAIILGDRSDKVVFPARRVIVMDLNRPALAIPQVRRALPRLADVVPLYYQSVDPPGVLPPKPITDMRFALVDPIALPDGTWLYRMIRP